MNGTKSRAKSLPVTFSSVFIKSFQLFVLNLEFPMGYLELLTLFRLVGLVPPSPTGFCLAVPNRFAVG